MTAEAVVRDYYASLRRGEALAPYFATDEATVKFGVSEALFGGSEVAEALREQTRSTEDWTVDSHDLVVRERDDWATFADVVDLAWTDLETGERWSFETRWSGALERRETTDTDDGRDGWAFVSMHVSAPRDL